MPQALSFNECIQFIARVLAARLAVEELKREGLAADVLQMRPWLTLSTFAHELEATYTAACEVGHWMDRLPGPQPPKWPTIPQDMRHW